MKQTLRFLLGPSQAAKKPSINGFVGLKIVLAFDSGGGWLRRWKEVPLKTSRAIVCVVPLGRVRCFFGGGRGQQQEKRLLVTR